MNPGKGAHHALKTQGEHLGSGTPSPLQPPKLPQTDSGHPSLHLHFSPTPPLPAAPTYSLPPSLRPSVPPSLSPSLLSLSPSTTSIPLSLFLSLSLSLSSSPFLYLSLLLCHPQARSSGSFSLAQPLVSGSQQRQETTSSGSKHSWGEPGLPSPGPHPSATALGEYVCHLHAQKFTFFDLCCLYAASWWEGLERVAVQNILERTLLLVRATDSLGQEQPGLENTPGPRPAPPPLSPRRPPSRAPPCLGLAPTPAPVHGQLVPADQHRV